MRAATAMGNYSIKFYICRNPQIYKNTYTYYNGSQRYNFFIFLVSMPALRQRQPPFLLLP